MPLNQSELFALQTALQQELSRLKDQLAALRAEFDSSRAAEVLERIKAVEVKVDDLRRDSEEAKKRSWQLVYLGVGAVLALLGGVDVQLVAFGLRK
jgi:hypothetical protein